MSEPKNKSKIPEWVSCQHSIELLQEYLDGTLPEEEKASLDRHFKACPPCVDFLRKYRATPSLCRRALDQEIPKELAERLSTFLRDQCKGKKE